MKILKLVLVATAFLMIGACASKRCNCPKWGYEMPVNLPEDDQA